MAKQDAHGGEELPARDFAQGKEPIEEACRVRAAIARFNQVEGVTNDERDAAWKRILTAEKAHGAELSGKRWREIGEG